MENLVNIKFPNLCGWCGSSDIVSTYKAKDVYKSNVVSTTLISTFLELSIPICAKCKKDVSMKQLNPFRKNWNDAFIVYGNNIEFVNREFHTQFANLNPEIAVSFIKENLVFPQLCAGCADEPPTTQKNGFSKGSISVPIGQKCKNNNAFVGVIIKGKICFSSIPYQLEFSRLNPSASYDFKKALIEGTYEKDYLEATDGFAPTGFPTSINDKNVDSKWDSILSNLHQEQSNYFPLTKSWFLACGFGENDSLMLSNVIFSSNDNHITIGLLRLYRLKFVLFYLLRILLCEMGLNGIISDQINDSVVLGFFSILDNRIFCRTNDYLKHLASEDDFKEIVNYKKDDNNDSSQLWKYLRNNYPKANEDMQTYLKKNWDILDNDLIDNISDLIFKNNLSQVYNFVNQYLLNHSENKEIAKQSSLKIYRDLKGIEKQISFLKSLPEEMKIRFEFLLRKP